MADLNHSTRLSINQQWLLYWFTFAIALIAPALTLLAIQVIVGDLSFKKAIADTLLTPFDNTDGLASAIGFGLIPYPVLVWKMLPIARLQSRRKCLTQYFCGLIGILILLIPAQVSVWYPHYGPGRRSSTEGITVLIVPIYCIVTCIFGLAIGRQIIKAKWFQAPPIGHCQHCGYNLTGNLSGKCSECGTDA